MSEDSKYQVLDSYVEYIKQVAIVILASFTAYYTVSNATEAYLPWVVLIFGVVIAYSLFLPYKRASMVIGEWAEVSRIKALSLIFQGIPMYLAPAIVVWFYNDMSSFLPIVKGPITASSLSNMVNSFFNGTVLLLIVSLIGAVLMNRPFLILLRASGYTEVEIDKIRRYKTGRSLAYAIGFSLIIIYSLMYLVAGWNTPSMASEYFLGALVLILLLVIFGFVHPILTSKATKSNRFILFETLFFLSVICTTISVSIAILSCIVGSIALYQLYRISKDNRKSIDLNQLVLQRQQREYEKTVNQELRKVELDLVSYIYYKLHPRVYTTLSVIVLFWWSWLFIRISEIGFLNVAILFFATGIPILVLPWMWVFWNQYRNNMEKIELEIKKLHDEGVLRFWQKESQ